MYSYTEALQSEKYDLVHGSEQVSHLVAVIRAKRDDDEYV